MLALCLGALGFLNSWDFPTYTGSRRAGLRAAALARRGAPGRRLVRRTLLVAGLVVGGLGLLLYLPFYLTFQSQASGLGLVLVEKTRLRQYLIIFGVFLWALLPLLLGRRVARLAAGWLGIALAAALPCAVGACHRLVDGGAASSCWSRWIVWRLSDPGAPRRRSSAGGSKPMPPAASTWRRRFALVLVVVGLAAHAGDRVRLHPRYLRQPDEHGLQALLPGLGAACHRRRLWCILCARAGAGRARSDGPGSLSGMVAAASRLGRRAGAAGAGGELLSAGGHLHQGQPLLRAAHAGRHGLHGQVSAG